MGVDPPPPYRTVRFLMSSLTCWHSTWTVLCPCDSPWQILISLLLDSFYCTQTSDSQKYTWLDISTFNIFPFPIFYLRKKIMATDKSESKNFKISGSGAYYVYFILNRCIGSTTTKGSYIADSLNYFFLQ